VGRLRLGHHDWTRCNLTLPNGSERVISALLWDIEPLAMSWGVQTAGLIWIDDTPEAREEGLTLFLLSETMRQYHAAGYAAFEAQAAADDTSLAGIFTRLGLAQYDEAALWAKT
jgi:hypothetical protein